ncbi:MAG: hypothetical protein JEZ08_04645 [Clostridiales bacterium]|nr:hypothetical protein [Clostridiales bacterium]
MNNKSLLLLKIQLLSLFGFNEIRYSDNKRQKRTLLLNAVGILVVGIFLGVYCFLSAISLQKGGMGDIIPAYALTSASIIIIVLTVFKTNGILFGFKDYDMVMSLPVKVSSIVISRFLMVYILNVFVALILTLPMGIVYGSNVTNGYISVLMMSISLLTIPLIPMTLAFTIGTLILLISSKFKHKNIAVTILSFALVLGVIYLNFKNRGEIQMEDLATISASLVKQMYTIYPIAELYANAILNHNIAHLILFVSISITMFLAFVRLVSSKFCEINTGMMTNNTKDNYQVEKLQISSPFIALYKKELKRYFMSTIYVLNTSIGILLLFVLTVIIGVFGIDLLETQMKVSGLEKIISTGGPMIISVMLIMSCTTSSAISLEGKNFWILKSLPINMKQIINSKIAVNLTILLPTTILSAVVLSLKTDQSYLGTVLLFATPLTYAFFIAVLGLRINLKYPNFTWKTEAMVVKQSISTISTMMIGFTSILVPTVAAFIIWPGHSEYIILINTVFIGILTQLLHTYMIKVLEH